MREVPESLVEAGKHALDAVSVGVTVGTILKLLPAIAAALSIVWTAIRIYEWWRGR